MRILIIEDEIPASTELIIVLREIDPHIIIEDVLQTMQEIDQRLSSFLGKVDLIFMDIQIQGENVLTALPDLDIPAPIIFVTAFDTYILEALQYTSLDYILKPISREKIQKGLAKYSEIKTHFLQGYNHLVKQMSHPHRKIRTRILLKKGTDFHFCKAENVAYFYSEFKLVFLMDFQEQKHLTDIRTLSLLEEELDPLVFYRVNRKFIVNINAIRKFKVVNRVKLSVELNLKVSEEIIVSQENASHFKNWIASKDDLDL